MASQFMNGTPKVNTKDLQNAKYKRNTKGLKIRLVPLSDTEMRIAYV